MLPRADEPALFQHVNRLMNKPGEIDGLFGFQRRFPGFQQRCHQFDALLEQIAYLVGRGGYHLGLRAAMHAHQPQPAVKPARQPFAQRLVLPEIAVINVPLQLVGQPLTPPLRLRFFLAALFAPGVQYKFMPRRGIVFQLADARGFPPALADNLQGQRMKRACGNGIRMQPRLQPIFHFFGGLTPEGEQQDLLRRRLTALDKPARARHQHRGFAAPGACQHQQRTFAVDDGSRLRRIKRRAFNLREEIGVARQHRVGISLIMQKTLRLTVGKPGLTFAPGVAAVIERLQARCRHRQRLQRPPQRMAQRLALVALKPLFLGFAAAQFLPPGI
ncbi:hypothetical protein BN131_3898 [Cronobacter malonaticus 681]|nr:hypothetical protein BN131_3898 [Cronobacter malonaticus 681]